MGVVRDCLASLSNAGRSEVKKSNTKKLRRATEPHSLCMKIQSCVLSRGLQTTQSRTRIYQCFQEEEEEEEEQQEITCWNEFASNCQKSSHASAAII